MDAQVMTELVNAFKYQNQEFEIEVNDKIITFWYKFDEEIFTISEPNMNISAAQKPNCNCCTEPFKSNKDLRYCEFCALAYCKECRYKCRVFPANPDEEEGEICLVCDRKFHIRNMLRDRNL